MNDRLRDAREDGTLGDLVDTRPGAMWDMGVAVKLLELALSCLQRRAERRCVCRAAE